MSLPPPARPRALEFLVIDNYQTKMGARNTGGTGPRVAPCWEGPTPEFSFRAGCSRDCLCLAIASLGLHTARPGANTGGVENTKHPR